MENIKSELLKQHWELISDTFKKAQEKYNECAKKNENDYEIRFKELIDYLTQEWEIIYPKFVLLPYKKEILNLFYKTQTNQFEKEKNIAEKISKFNVFYYLCQYCYIFIIPNTESDFKYEDYPRFEISTDDPNLLLYEIFNELWSELNKENLDSEFEELEYSELGKFYKIEFNLLCSFLSKCWNETKIQTGSNVIATLSESTGVGEHYFLDQNRVLSDKELDDILNE